MIQCGLPDRRVSVSYAQDLQEDIVRIADDKASLSDTMLACLAHVSLNTKHDVYFRNESDQRRYWTIFAKIETEVAMADAKD